jgi:hypothetical protein
MAPSPRHARHAAADVPLSDPQIPVPALVGGILGIVGAMPLAFVALTAVALGGLRGDTGPDPWTYVLLVVPLLQLWAAVWLLARRAWLPLVLVLVPVAALVAAVIWVVSSVKDAGGLGWPLMVLAAPALAAVLAATPRVRRWVAGRPPRGGGLRRAVARG